MRRNAFAVILVDERRGERVVLWHRDPALALQPGEIDASVVGPSRLIHVDESTKMPRSARHRIGRSAGIPVTSDIEQVTERTEELVAAVTISIFAEHVHRTVDGRTRFRAGLRKIQRDAAGPLGPGQGSG